MRLQCIAERIASRVYGENAKFELDTRVNDMMFEMRVGTFVDGERAFLELRFYDEFIDVITVKNTDMKKVLEILDDYSKLKSVRFIEESVHSEHQELFENLGLVRVGEFRYAVVPESFSLEEVKEVYDF